MKNSGFTLIELMIVVTLLAILLVMALPNFYRMRLSTRKTLCINNLRQIEAAVDRWVFDSDISDGAITSTADEEEIYSYIRSGKPVCVSGGSYTIAVIGAYPQAVCDIEGHTLVEE